MRVVFLKERADSSLISGPADQQAWGSNLEANTLFEVQKFESNFLITVECFLTHMFDHLQDFGPLWGAMDSIFAPFWPYLGVVVV